MKRLIVFLIAVLITASSMANTVAPYDEVLKPADIKEFASMAAYDAPLNKKPNRDILQVTRVDITFVHFYAGDPGRMDLLVETNFGVSQTTSWTVDVWQYSRVPTSLGFPRTYAWMWHWATCGVWINPNATQGFFYYQLQDGEQIDPNQYVVYGPNFY
jgi:hypothetical protein